MRKIIILLTLIAVFASGIVIASATTVTIEAGVWDYGVSSIVWSNYTPLDGLPWGKGSVKNANGAYYSGPWVTYTQTSYSSLIAVKNKVDHSYYARKS